MTANDTHTEEVITIRLTKRNGQVFDILLSPEDEVLGRKRWSAMIGRNGHVYAHRTENKQKVYLGPLILSRKLDRDLAKGEKCIHLNGKSWDYTRDNITSSKLPKEHS